MFQVDATLFGDDDKDLDLRIGKDYDESVDEETEVAFFQFTRYLY